MSRVQRDLDGIQTLLEPGTALTLAERIEKGILSLDQMSCRYPVRQTGAYANRGYRQLLVGSYTVIYRMDEVKKQVIVVTVRYSPNNF